MIVWSARPTVVQHVRDADRVGDDGEAGDVGQALGERVGRRAGRDADRHARARRARRPRRRSRPSRPACRRTWPRTSARTGRCPRAVVAPPWTFSSRPRSSRISRSRRTVMSDTPSSRTRSATRTAPSSRTRSRMKAWRWRASITRPLMRSHGVPSRPARPRRVHRFPMSIHDKDCARDATKVNVIQHTVTRNVSRTS